MADRPNVGTMPMGYGPLVQEGEFEDAQDHLIR